MSIGAARTRVEGPAKVTGAAKDAANNHPVGLRHGVFVGSPIAHGTVTGTDAQDALRVPGVLQVLTAADMPQLGELPPIIAEVRKPTQDDRIEWEGEPVAMVLAESLEAAEEAAALVRVSVEALEPIVPGRGEIELPPQEQGPTLEAKGDVEAGLASAAVTVSQDYHQPTRHHNPMETSATVASWSGDNLTLWSATQHGWASPPVMAAAFGIGPANVRQVTPHTDGAFGVKSFVSPHEILTAAAARVVGRPVHMSLSRPQMYAQKPSSGGPST